MGGMHLTAPLTSLSIPATLQDSLMARLDRLATAKGLAQQAAVIGRQFSYALLQAVSELDYSMLQRELKQLVDAELLYQRGLPPQAIYTFKHALIQDIAYASLLRQTRQGHHRRIAEALEAQFPETIATQPELAAHHYAEAGMNEQAVDYWQQAGERAVARSANQEAIHHLTQALELLKALPSSAELLRQELALQLSLAVVFHALEGQSSDNIECAYLRARELCELVADRQQLFHVLLGLWRCYGSPRESQKTGYYVDELFHLASHLDDSTLLLEALMARGTNFLHESELAIAREHLEQVINTYNPQDHLAYISRSSIDPGVTSYSRLSWTLWFLGYPDQALDAGRKTIALARQVRHANSLGLAYNFTAILCQLCGEYEAVHEQVEAALLLATEHNLSQRKIIAAILQGWHLTCLGQLEEGIAQMQQGIAAYHASGTHLYREWFLSLLAKAYGDAGQSAAGLETLAEAMTYSWPCWDPEFSRLKGELLLQQSPDNQSEAETCFRQAIAMAQSQNAKSWELRAATSLARLWRSQGKRREAQALLGDVYDWFTEGFGTADLQDARALLDELASS